MRLGFWCDKLPRCNSMILSACLPADRSLCYQLQSKRFCLLTLLCFQHCELICFTGFRPDVQRPRYDTREAEVGQNITIHCSVENLPKLEIVNIEWKKNNESTKLALFSQGHGVNLFWPNVTFSLQYENSSKLLGSYLQLPEVKQWDSGLYICDIGTFPYGTIRSETYLKIKGKKTKGKFMQSRTCTPQTNSAALVGSNVWIRLAQIPSRLIVRCIFLMLLQIASERRCSAKLRSYLLLSKCRDG